MFIIEGIFQKENNTFIYIALTFAIIISLAKSMTGAFHHTKTINRFLMKIRFVSLNLLEYSI